MATWLITGCSTGLGRAFAEAVLDHGDNVVATARDVAKVQDLAETHPESALALALDVTDHAQIVDAVRSAEQRFGRVDVLVNNAGYGYRAAVEEAETDRLQQLFATNFFGAVEMIRAVLPGMRARRAGTIINISSIGARISPAGSGYYAATKAALEAMTASLRTELAPLGIAAMVVEPGAFRTDFSGRSLTESVTPIADYRETAGLRRKEHDTAHGTQQGDPARAATSFPN
jgi:NAD(P)-dependent dehydrogenase (short-subunit alcohol dehydrogenase family)